MNQVEKFKTPNPVVDRRQEARPKTGEAPFAPGEVFYSRTDRHGIILGGNYTFYRISNYPWDELIGAPHKLVRHPDMPRAVLHIMWERIQKGEVFGSYIKNRAKDGLHYWLFAVFIPWQDGFLSARIKPTSARLKVVQDLYRKTRAWEERDGLTPAESAARMIENNQELGYDDYRAFETDSLAEELLAERTAVGAPPDDLILHSRRVLQEASRLGDHTRRLLDEFTSLTSITQNMQIKAFQLEPEGGPVTELSKTYGDMSDEISDWFARNVVSEDSNFAKITARVSQALLLNGTASILNRCLLQLKSERRHLGRTDPETERQKISELMVDYLEGAGAAVSNVADEALRISKMCKDMHRNLMGLKIICVTCKIENARLGDASGSLDEIVMKLEVVPANIERHIAEIKTCAEAVASAADLIKWREDGFAPPQLRYG